MARLLAVGTSVCLLAAAASLPNGQGCQTSVAQAFPYCDLALSVDERVQDLVARPTLKEVVSRLRSSALAPGIDSIGLPPQNYRVEGVRGLEAYCMKVKSQLVCPTYFPAPQGMLATFNTSVWSSFGTSVGEEARVWTNMGGLAKSKRAMGPSVRCPMVNLLRDPRWGQSSPLS